MRKTNFFKWALTLALSGCIFFSGSAADIYVSATGDDNSAGTELAPVLTLAKAYQLMGNQAGTIYVSGNVVANTTGDGLDLNGIDLTVEGVEGTDAGITGDSIRFFYVRNNAVLTLKNLHLAGNPDKSLVGQGGCISIFQGGGLFAENVVFEDFSTALNPVNDPANGGNLNNDTGAGGVVFVNQLNVGSSNPVLSFKNCLFKNNSTTGNWGGGVIRVQDFGAAVNPKVYFENCGFYGNSTFRGNPGGSVIVVRAGSATNSEISFVNSTITACGTGASGAIALSSANITLNVINSTIKDNPVSGIICWEQSNSKLNIYNSVIENNAGANMNDVRFSEKAGTATDSAKIHIRNSLIGNPLWRNVPAEKIPYTKPGNYTVNDLFEAFNATTISFTPKSGSLAINYGDAQYLTALDIDYDQLSNVRVFMDNKCDAGAIETTKNDPTTALEREKAADLKIFQSEEKLHIINTPEISKIELISLSGNILKTSFNNELFLIGLNKGLYILKIKSGTETFTQKTMIR